MELAPREAPEARPNRVLGGLAAGSRGSLRSRAATLPRGSGWPLARTSSPFILTHGS